MHYFVTGATGFIGKRLVKKLLERKGAVVHFLIRKESGRSSTDPYFRNLGLRPANGPNKSDVLPSTTRVSR